MGRLLNIAFLLPILVLLAVGFAVWGWSAQAAALGFTPLDVIYNALHAVTLSTNYAYSERYHHDWRIETARVLGTVAFLIAATQAVRRLLHYHVSRYFGRFRTGHLLVIGDHPVAHGIVQAATRRAAKVTWIANSEGDAPVVPGALVVPQLWDKHLATQFNAQGAGRAVVAFVNEVQQVAAVRELRATAPALPITMNFGDAWFAERMDELENIQGVRFVSQVQLSVRDLHWRNPPFLAASRLGHPRLHALLFGLGRGGEAVLTDLLLSSLTGFLGRPRVTIVDPRAAEISRSLAQRCPALHQSVDLEIIEPGHLTDVRVLPLEDLRRAHAIAPFTSAYVCLDEDIRAMALAVSLQALARREGWTMGPIFTRLVHGGALPEAPSKGETAGLVVFGATQNFADAIGLFESDCDALPRAFHEAYRRNAPHQAVANLPWEDLPEELRESNRRLLIHVPAKLATAGVDVESWLDAAASSRGPVDGIALPDLGADPALLERLAELEHARWMMERHLSGWQHGPLRDNTRRIHPDLVPYAELKDSVRHFDRAMVLEAWAALDSTGHAGFAPQSAPTAARLAAAAA